MIRAATAPTRLLALIVSLFFVPGYIRNCRTSRTVKRFKRIWNTPIPEELGYQDGYFRYRYSLGNGNFLFVYSTSGKEHLKYKVQIKGCAPKILTPADGWLFNQIRHCLDLGRKAP
jgi:hypothetical protein